MALTGTERDCLEKFIAKTYAAVKTKRKLTQSKVQKNFNETMSELTEVLQEAVRLKSAELSLHLERESILLEKEIYAVNKEYVAQLEGQITDSGNAEKSLELVKDKKAYKEYVEGLFPNGRILHLPTEEAYIKFAGKQKMQLGREHRASEQEIKFLAARQKSLSAGIAAFKELQREALGLPKSRNKQERER